MSIRGLVGLQLAVVLAACGGERRFARVTVPDLPAEASTLYVLVNVDGRDVAPEEFELAAGHGAVESFTLGFADASPAGTTSVVSLGVGARDAQGCELGWGTLKFVPASERWA